MGPQNIFFEGFIFGCFFGWQKNNWITASKKPVANRSLWKELFNLTKNQNVEWVWVKGHAGVLGNEKADSLAIKGREEASNEFG